MMNNLLLNKIKEIQNEYLILLKLYAIRFNSENYVYLIDEIDLFWYKYRRLIQIFLESLDSSIDVYVLTGITYLDVKNKNIILL